MTRTLEIRPDINEGIDRKVLLAGARLWRQDLPNGVQDFDFAAVRMQGDAIFSDGLEF